MSYLYKIKLSIETQYSRLAAEDVCRERKKLVQPIGLTLLTKSSANLIPYSFRIFATSQW